ncbi:MAG: pirin family protein [Candidatus Omnitrophica bacterium]|nr:pirin family protein [Candidatus Omnitrophota bacterium]
MGFPTENVVLRRSHERGYFDHGWLKTYHSFSFGDYYDPDFMGFHHLRVLNEDFIAAGRGFTKHPHNDMEIFTYVLEGSLEHQDSMGNTSVIHAGEVQKMTAGTGIYHSERNHSSSQPIHLLQIWILPNKKGLAPSYQQFALQSGDSSRPVELIGSPKGSEKVLQFHQDVEVYRGLMKKEMQHQHSVGSARSVWIQIIKGILKAGAYELKDGDGLGMHVSSGFALQALDDTEFLLFDFKN